MKNRDLVDSIESINALAALKLPVRTSFAVALNLKSVKDLHATLDEQRKKIVDAHTRKGADGNPLPVYVPEKDANGNSLLESNGDPILVKDENGNIKNKVVEGQVRLIDGAAFNKEMIELLDMDITDLLVIRPIKLSDLTGSLEPQHFVNLLWMIHDDTETKEK